MKSVRPWLRCFGSCWRTWSQTPPFDRAIRAGRRRSLPHLLWAPTAIMFGKSSGALLSCDQGLIVLVELDHVAALRSAGPGGGPHVDEVDVAVLVGGAPGCVRKERRESLGRAVPIES